MCGVGNGENVGFWSDPWADAKPLSILFPRLFANCTNKTAWLNEVGLFARGKWVSDIPFRRLFFGWELEIFNNFMMLLNSCCPTEQEGDYLIWCGSNNGYFSVKGLCQGVENQVYEGEPAVENEGFLKSIPPKVRLLFWQACHNKIATKQNLRKRGMDVGDGGMSVFCRATEESNDHLFLHCSKVKFLWDKIMQLTTIDCVCPSSLSGIWMEWSTLETGLDNKIWSSIPLALVWSLWLSRNALVFRGTVATLEEVWEMTQIRVAWWVKVGWPH